MQIDRTVLKKLWKGEQVLCPKCEKSYLIPLHKNKKDYNDFQCPNCKEVFRTLNRLKQLLNKDK
jgi:uncharacterized C2H2 Zn-finger protein